MQTLNSVIGEFKNNIILNPVFYRTIANKAIGSDGTLYNRDSDNTANVLVYKVSAGTKKIKISGIEIYSLRKDPTDTTYFSQEIKYFYQEDNGKIFTRDKWIVAALYSHDDETKGAENLIQESRLNVDTYKAIESEYFKSHKPCSETCGKCCNFAGCVKKFKNDIVYEMNINPEIFVQNGNQDVYLYVSVASTANLSVVCPDYEIKRIDELQTIAKDAEYYHTINDYVIGSSGSLYHNEHVKIDIFKIKKETEKLLISNINVFTLNNPDAAHEIKLHPKRGSWPVATLCSCEIDPKEITQGSVNLIKNHRINVNEYNKCEEQGLINPVELKIDKKIYEEFEEQNVYLFICTAKNSSNLDVKESTYKTEGELYFEEEPVAEAITDGDTLDNSKIFFGSVVKNGKLIEKGICLWEKPKTKVVDNGKDYQEFKAFFYKPLHPRFLKQDIEFFKDHRNFLISRKKEFQKRLARYLCVGWFMLPVPVYTKSNHRFDTFVWEKNFHSEPDVLEPDFIANVGVYSRRNLLQYKSHHQYKDILESYSLANIYNSYESIAKKSPEDVAKIIVQNIARQPKGFRSISFDDGVLKIFFGGPIRIADNIRLVDTSGMNGEEKAEANKTNKLLRAQKDYLYSMVYFGEDDTDATDKLCGDGYYFYDAPIHVNNPKIKTKPEGIETYIEDIKTLYCNANVHKEGEDVNKNISSSEAFCNLMDKIFKIVNSYGITIDYAYHDFEIMRGTGHEIRNNRRLELANSVILNDIPYFPNNYKSMKNALWNSLKEVSQNVEPYSYQDVYKKLCKRGFTVLDESDPLDDASVTGAVYYYGYLSYATGTSEKHCDVAYIRRRNLNIWDQVANEYITGLFDKFMMEPIRKYSPNMRCSMWAVDEQKGYSHIASEFETSLGGNAQLPSKMGSTPIMYGTRSFGIYKHNLYNWKTLPCATAPFDTLACTINAMRSAKFSNPSKPVMPIISCADYWTTIACGANDSEYATRCHKYYREMLFHTWLCNPEMMYAYIVYTGFNDRNYKFYKLDDDKKNAPLVYVKKDDYYREVYQRIQEITQEVKSLVGTCKSTLITKKLASETDPFVITEVRIGCLRLYRFSFNDEFELKISKKRIIPKLKKLLKYRKLPKLPRTIFQDILFEIHGKSILFKKAAIVNRSKEFEKEPGFWIVSNSSCAPSVKTSANYYLENPSWEINDFRNVNLENAKDALTIVTEKDTKGINDVLRMLKPNLVTVFGEPAKTQKISTTINFEAASKSKTVLHTSIMDEKFKEKKEYTLERTLDFNKSVLKQNKDGVFYRELNSPVYCPENGFEKTDATMDVSMDCNNDVLWSKPRDYLDIYRDSSASHEEFEECVKNAKFKSCIQGSNFRVDVFRESDGINVTEMEKYYSEDDLKKMCCSPSDLYTLKFSWLNATDKCQKYNVVMRQYSKCRILLKPFEKTFNIAAGDENYCLCKYGSFLNLVEWVNIFVEHDGEEQLVGQIVFKRKDNDSLPCVNTIIGKAIGSDGTLYHQDYEAVKIESFKIPAGTSKVSIYGLDVYSINHNPDCINSQEIKYHPKRTKWIVATLCSSAELYRDDNAIEKLYLIPNHRINVDTFNDAESRGESNPMAIEIAPEIQKQDSYLFVCVSRTATLSVKLS